MYKTTNQQMDSKLNKYVCFTQFYYSKCVSNGVFVLCVMHSFHILFTFSHIYVFILYISHIEIGWFFGVNTFFCECAAFISASFEIVSFISSSFFVLLILFAFHLYSMIAFSPELYSFNFFPCKMHTELSFNPISLVNSHVHDRIFMYYTYLFYIKEQIFFTVIGDKLKSYRSINIQYGMWILDNG